MADSTKITLADGSVMVGVIGALDRVGGNRIGADFVGSKSSVANGVTTTLNFALASVPFDSLGGLVTTGSPDYYEFKRTGIWAVVCTSRPTAGMTAGYGTGVHLIITPNGSATTNTGIVNDPTIHVNGFQCWYFEEGDQAAIEVRNGTGSTQTYSLNFSVRYLGGLE